MQKVIRGAKTHKKELVVGWLSLSNIFNSVPYSSIFRAMMGNGLPTKAINTITSLCGKMKSHVKTVEAVITPIQIRPGVKQGCSLCPDAFNLVLGLVLRSMTKMGAGYTIEGQRVP